MDEFSFMLVVLAPGRASYAAFFQQLWDNGCIEDLAYDFTSDDPEVQAFMRERFGWTGAGDPPQLPALIEALAERFPPPFRHWDILRQESDRRRLARGRLDQLLSRDAAQRANSRIAITITLKSPEAMDVAAEAITDYLELQYKPMMLDLVGHEDFFPDDFEPTLNLLQGEPDIIRKSERTVELTLPCRDVTNSVWLLDQALKNRFVFDSEALVGGEDVHALALELGTSPCQHLFCFAFGDTCTLMDNVGWSVISLGE